MSLALMSRPRIRFFRAPRLSLNGLANMWKRFTNSLGNLKSTISDYIEVVVLLVLAPTILKFWVTFKSSVDQQYQPILSALTIVVVLGIAVAAIEKLSK